MGISGIPSARKELERAKVHLAALHGAVDKFRENSPYGFAMESPGNQRWKPGIPVMVTVTQAPPMPDDWALIAGDILTNVRAALDHAVFPHIRAKKPDLDRKFIQYPIEDRKEQWENKNRWFEKPVHKVVGESQPGLSMRTRKRGSFCGDLVPLLWHVFACRVIADFRRLTSPTRRTSTPTSARC
jgi:hypothetical protein